MRADLRLRLRQLTHPLSTAKKGVAGVADVATPARPTLPHVPPHLVPIEKSESDQRATLATPCHTLRTTEAKMRHTLEGVAGGVAERVAGVWPGVAAEDEDWLAADERAGLLEFDYNLTRAATEARAGSEPGLAARAT